MKRLLVLMVTLAMVISLAAMAYAENTEAADAVEDTTIYTLIVDGVVVPFAQGDEVPENGILVETPKYRVQENDEAYRAALYVKDGAQNDASVLAALGDASVDGTALKGAAVSAENNDFSGIIIEDSEYAIQDSAFTMTGNTTSDCSGLGAAVYAVGSSRVWLDNVSVSAKGVRHPAMVVDNLAEMYVSHSEFHTADAAFFDESKPTTSFVPWCLGVSGTSRAINLLGNGHITYFDSVMTSEKWGVLAFEDDEIESTNSVAIGVTVSHVHSSFYR